MRARSRTLIAKGVNSSSFAFGPRVILAVASFLISATLATPPQLQGQTLASNVLKPAFAVSSESQFPVPETWWGVSCRAAFPVPAHLPRSTSLLFAKTDPHTDDSSSKTPDPTLVRVAATSPLSTRSYYRNKLEFSLNVGWLPINIPFVFDFLLGDGYNMTPLKYTLVPVIGSLRWQFDDVGAPWILRGNWDVTFSGSVTAIPRGPETRYYSYLMGIRRNFVPHRETFAPYLDGRLGMGNIDAKGPKGVAYAQGQDFTFTLNLGSGVRYNINPRYSISAGLNYMHISNLYLSEPKYRNYGINVYGPMVGMDIRLGRQHASSR
jgi:hypothetical protein